MRAGPWVWYDDTSWRRRDVDGGSVGKVSTYQAARGLRFLCWAVSPTGRVVRQPSTQFKTVDDAKRAVDLALEAMGWTLDEGEAGR